MQHLCVSTPVNPFHKIVTRRFFVLIIMMLLHNTYIRAHNSCYFVVIIMCVYVVCVPMGIFL